MNRLGVRLIVSHLLVAVVGGLATFLVVRALTPVIFDRAVGFGPGHGRGNMGLRTAVAAAVTQALVIGGLVGVLAAALVGAFAAARLARPLRRLSESTRRIAAGGYDVSVSRPRTVELAALADDVNTLGHALQETETRRVRLLGELAHEMRTPLTVIDGYVEGMIDGVLPKTPRELGKVSDEVRRLRRLSDDLSALSRAEEGRLSLAPRQVDIAVVVGAAAERLRPQAQDAGLTLTVRVPQHPVEALIDPDRIAQVVTNLVGNAVAATPAGGTVAVRLSADGQSIDVEVADTGEGLAPEEVERIFERFYRAPRRRRVGHEGGSGIGLTIARGIVRAHGGELTARSPGLGHGATFIARLPRRDGHVAEASGQF